MPAMCGSATLATEESSTTMKVAIITDAAIIHGFASGFQACSSASVRLRILLGVLIRLSIAFVSRGWLPVAITRVPLEVTLTIMRDFAARLFPAGPCTMGIGPS